MGRPRGAATRILSTEDRGGRGAKRHRVRYVLNGRESARGFATARQAQKFIDQFEAEAVRASGKTVEMTIEDWKADRIATGQYMPAYYERHVKRCLRDVLDQPLVAATGGAAADGWEDYAGGVAGATAAQALATLRIFAKWMVKRKLALVNITEGIEFEGQINKGKPQIETVRELYAFRDVVWARAEAGDRGSLGVLIGLYLGLRSAEVLALEARHIDVNHTVVVPGTKTAAAKRRVPVMVPRLWDLLDAAAKEGGFIVTVSQDTLIRRVRDAATAAKVSNATGLVFHSLRGMAASLATKSGAAFAAIAEGLGHTSYDVTAKHYASMDSQDAAATGAATSVLDGAPLFSQSLTERARERN